MCPAFPASSTGAAQEGQCLKAHRKSKQTQSPLDGSVHCKTMALLRVECGSGQASGSKCIFILICFEAVGPRQTESVSFLWRMAGL